MRRAALVGIIIGVTLAASATADDFIYHGSFLWNDIRAVVSRGNFLFCAFHDGVGAINLDLDFSKKKPYATIEVPGLPTRLHLCDNLLIVETEDGEVFLIDVSNPAEMISLGSFTSQWEVLDLAVLGSYLYAAVEYDGIVRYDISDPAGVHFDDSSMAGICVVRLEVYDSRLYALDTYNGIVIYEPDNQGFGAPVSWLYLPDQAISFAVFNDTVYAGTRPSGYMVGSVADVYHPEYVGVRTSFIRGDYIMSTDQGLVFANSINGFELIYDGDTLVDQLFPVPGILGYPEAFSYEGRQYIIYPHRTRGFVAFDIGDPVQIDPDRPEFVYAYPGPITQLEFVNSRLHVIGTYNWYEMYDVSDPAAPVRTGKMINPPWQPAGICTKGDTLFVADEETNTFFPAVDKGVGDPLWFFPYFSVADPIARPHLVPGYFGDMDLIYFFKDNTLNGSARNDTLILTNRFRWSFPTGVSAALIDGHRLYHVSDKSILHIYGIDRNFRLVEAARYDLPGRANDMLKRDTLLYLLSPGLRTYSIADPIAPVLVNAVTDFNTGYEMTVFDSWLICATQAGVRVFDLTHGIPEPVFSGGAVAVVTAYDGHILAASDGHSVRLYAVPGVDVDDVLPEVYEVAGPRIYGYPNPFNPVITLVLENFASRADGLTVDVFDIIGRRVRRLTTRSGGTGRDEIKWDGHDDGGRQLPSGVYFFRADGGGERAVFKAIMVK